MISTLAAPPREICPRQSGLTLVEFLVALSILSILVGIAAPSFRTFLATTRVTSAANELLASVQLARTEAVKRSRFVGLCPSTNGTSCAAAPSAPALPNWAAGWLAWEDADADGTLDAVEDVLRVYPALSSTLTVSGPASLVLQKLGNTATASPNFTLTGPGALATRYLCVSASGASRVQAGNCS